MARRLAISQRKRVPKPGKRGAAPLVGETRSTAPLTEEETVALFLEDMLQKVPGSGGVEGCEVTCGGEEGAEQSMGGGTAIVKKHKKKVWPEVGGRLSRKRKATSAAETLAETGSSSLLVGAGGGKNGLPLPLEEGEEDPSVSVEVLQQVRGFLAALSPMQSKQFWALRQVARGEKKGRTVPKHVEHSLDEDDIEAHASSVSGGEGTSDDEMREEPRSPGEWEVEQKGKRIRTRKSGGCGGGLFKGNPDVWED